MIKKIFIFLFSLILVFTISINVNASINPDDFPDGIFQYTNTGSTSHMLYTGYFMPLPSTFNYFELYIPNTSYITLEEKTELGLTYKSKIIFYKKEAGITVSQSYDLQDFVREEYGSIIFDSATIADLGLEQYSSFYLELMCYYSDHADPIFISWLNDRFDYGFEELEVGVGSFTTYYYIGNKIYYISPYMMTDDIPDRPIDPHIDNLTFRGWRLPDGQEYNFTTPIENVYGEDLILSAKFVIQGIENRPDIHDNTPSAMITLLNFAGLNNTFGKILIYVIVLVFTSALLLWFKLDDFAIVIVEAVIFGGFIFLGWIPIYMIVILGIMFIIVIIKSVTKGG